jgi:hypothetical protein
MNGVNKVTDSVRQNDTSVFLIGDIYDPTTKSQIYDKMNKKYCCFSHFKMTIFYCQNQLKIIRNLSQVSGIISALLVLVLVSV